MNHHTVLFFGPLQDQIGVKRKVVELPENGTLIALLDKLGIDSSNVKIAVNGEIVSIATKLDVECEIALLPPVSGG